jgi:hypothetical protein
MGNREIRLEWIPSAYREASSAGKKIESEIPSVKATLYTSKDIYAKQGFKRKFIK